MWLLGVHVNLHGLYNITIRLFCVIFTLCVYYTEEQKMEISARSGGGIDAEVRRSRIYL